MYRRYARYCSVSPTSPRLDRPLSKSYLFFHRVHIPYNVRHKSTFWKNRRDTRDVRFYFSPTYKVHHHLGDDAVPQSCRYHKKEISRYTHREAVEYNRELPYLKIERGEARARKKKGANNELLSYTVSSVSYSSTGAEEVKWVPVSTSTFFFSPCTLLHFFTKRASFFFFPSLLTQVNRRNKFSRSWSFFSILSPLNSLVEFDYTEVES